MYVGVECSIYSQPLQTLLGVLLLLLLCRLLLRCPPGAAATATAGAAAGPVGPRRSVPTHSLGSTPATAHATTRASGLKRNLVQRLASGSMMREM